MVPSVTAPRRRATYADLLEVPEHLVAEIIDGELLTSPRPASPHALAASAIGSALFDRFNGPPGGADRPGGWWILFEPELHLGEDVLVPDHAGWRRERMPALPDVVGFTLAPDWVCEVISPSTARIDRGRKLRVYAREQVALHVDDERGVERARDLGQAVRPARMVGAREHRLGARRDDRLRNARVVGRDDDAHEPARAPRALGYVAHHRPPADQRQRLPRQPGGMKARGDDGDGRFHKKTAAGSPAHADLCDARRRRRTDLAPGTGYGPSL